MHERERLFTEMELSLFFILLVSTVIILLFSLSYASIITAFCIWSLEQNMFYIFDPVRDYWLKDYLSMKIGLCKLHHSLYAALYIY